MGLDEDTYSVSIPLGATVNMAGAAVTITVMALAAAHTTGITVDFGTALVLSVLAAVSAAGRCRAEGSADSRQHALQDHRAEDTADLSD